jgi:hypothetical protein
MWASQPSGPHPYARAGRPLLGSHWDKRCTDAADGAAVVFCDGGGFFETGAAFPFLAQAVELRPAVRSAEATPHATGAGKLITTGSLASSSVRASRVKARPPSAVQWPRVCQLFHWRPATGHRGRLRRVGERRFFDKAAGLDQASGAGLALGFFELRLVLGEPRFLLRMAAPAFGKRDPGPLCAKHPTPPSKVAAWCFAAPDGARSVGLRSGCHPAGAAVVAVMAVVVGQGSGRSYRMLRCR